MANRLGKEARKYNVDFGIPKIVSNLTNTMPNKKADNSAPTPSIRNSTLGLVFFQITLLHFAVK